MLRKRVSMSVNVRKRSSTVMLDTPVVSHLAFDKERFRDGAAIFASGIPSSSLISNVSVTTTSLAPTRAQHTQGTLERVCHLNYATEKKRQKLSTISEVVACDGARDARSAGTTDSSKRIGPTIDTSTIRDKRESKTGEEGLMQEGGAAPWGSGGWLGLSRRVGISESSAGRSREESQGPALVQLKIDAMFTPGGAHKTATNNQERKTLPEGMDTENDGVATATDDDIVRAEIGPTCYVCRGGLGNDGGDVLCSFCDRAACEGCSQNCCVCEMPHCSLCLAADFSTQFESYLCPPCIQDNKREACGSSMDDVVT